MEHEDVAELEAVCVSYLTSFWREFENVLYFLLPNKTMVWDFRNLTTNISVFCFGVARSKTIFKLNPTYA